MNISIKEIKEKNLTGIYKDIAENINIETAVVLYKHYKGLQVTFPVRLFSKEFVIERLKEEYNGKNLKELAIKYEYSERWIRSLINDSFKE